MESQERLSQIATNLNFLPSSALIELDPNRPQLVKMPIGLDWPAYLVRPTTIAELAQTIQVASRLGWGLIPCGSGSKLDWGGIVKPVNLLVSTAQLNRIVDHAVGDLTVTVEAGVKLADLQEYLYPSKQFWPIDPAYPQTATIGGIVATADAGSWRQRYGGVRDLILGIEFVRADGEQTKAGGRVVKNVAGYDLMKLLTGSYGTLGVISRVTLRLYPIQSASATVCLWGELAAVAAAAKQLSLSGLTPTKADLISGSMLETIGKTGEAGLVVAFESIGESVQAQCRAIEAIANQLDLATEVVTNTAQTQLWQKLWSQIFVDSAQSLDNQSSTVIKVGVLPTDVPQLISQLQPRDIANINISTGVGKLRLIVSSTDQVSQIRAFTQQHGGYSTILESSADLKQAIDPWAIPSQALAVMQKLKQKFDPQNILSPGRMLDAD